MGVSIGRSSTILLSGAIFMCPDKKHSMGYHLPIRRNQDLSPKPTARTNDRLGVSPTFRSQGHVVTCQARQLAASEASHPAL
jgi:hypothetical protein